MLNLFGILQIEIFQIGILQIDYIKLKTEDSILRSEISTIQFGIQLNNNEIFKEKKIKNIFYVIKNYKDGKTKRPVYKSDEYEAEFNKKKQTSLVRLESNILCRSKND